MPDTLHMFTQPADLMKITTLNQKIYSRAVGQCECKLTDCGHVRACPNALIPGEWKVRMIDKIKGFTEENCEALCRRCFNYAEPELARKAT